MADSDPFAPAITALRALRERFEAAGVSALASRADQAIYVQELVQQAYRVAIAYEHAAAERRRVQQIVEKVLHQLQADNAADQRAAAAFNEQMLLLRKTFGLG